MPKYAFRLDRMHVKFQRSKKGDLDIVTFGVTVGNREIGPLTWLTGAGSGDTVQFSAHKPQPPLPGRREIFYAPRKLIYTRWGVGPIDISDDDIINVMYGIVNVSDSKEGRPNEKERLQIALATWGGLVGVAAAVSGGPVGAIVGAVIAGIAGLATVLIEIFVNEVNCNGVVGADKIAITGAQLRRGTNNPEGIMSFTSNSGNPDIPEECGHPSEVAVTFSAILLPSISLRQFIQNNLDTGVNIVNPNSVPSIRGILKEFPDFNTSPISIRSLIES